MQTLERVAALLRRAISPDGIAAILAELGFPAPPLPLDRDAIAALGLPTAVRSARITQGNGALRGLALAVDDSGDTRAILIQVANALARNAPPLLWLVVANHASVPEAAIMCWRSDGTRVRVASSVWRPDRVALSDAETLCTLAAAVC